MSNPLRRALSLTTFVVGIGLAVSGFTATIPGFVADIRERAEFDAGCLLEQQGEGWLIADTRWRGSPCDPHVGRLVTAVDGQPVADRDAMIEATYSDERDHVWRMSAPGGTEDVPMRYGLHQVVADLSNADADDGANGDTNRASWFVSAVQVFGVFTLVTNSLLSAMLLFFLSRRLSVGPALIGALMAVTFGVNFDAGFTPAWYIWVRMGCDIGAALGLATAMVALPDGKIPANRSVVFVAIWVMLRGVLAWPHLQFQFPEVPAIASAVSWVFAALGVGGLVVRQQQSASRREELALRWVILGLLMPGMAMLPLLVRGIPPELAVFITRVGFPLSTIVVPLAIVHGLNPPSRFDLFDAVRRYVLGGITVIAAALWILVLHVAVTRSLLHRGVRVDPMMLTAGYAVLSVGLVLWYRQTLAMLVDLLFFPMRLRAQRAIIEAAQNLGDCADAGDVIWCVERAVRSGLSGSGAEVVVPDGDAWVHLSSRANSGVTWTPEEWAALVAGEPVETQVASVDAPEGEHMWMVALPLQSHGELIGVMIAYPPASSRYSAADILVLQAIAEPAAQAAWRCTRAPSRKPRARPFAERPIVPRRAT